MIYQRIHMNSINIKDLELSLSANPNITLAEYLNQLNERQKIEREKRAEQLNNRVQWYKDLIGRYFIINFNGCAYSVVNVDKMFSSDLTTQFPVYNIYRSKDKFSIDKENRIINKLWFNCPYEDEYYGKGTTKVKEITKEEFENFTKLYESQSMLFNSLNLD